MPDIIDKLALVAIRDRRILCARTRGRTAWYLPGGKRKPGETDHQALARETHEELGVELLLPTLMSYQVFEAQAHGQPEGTMVRLTCYTGRYKGTPEPHGEVEELRWLRHSDKHLTTAASKELFDDLLLHHLID